LIGKGLTQQQCFQRAFEQGFKYVGLRYGQECNAGHEKVRYGKTKESTCYFKCPNDDSKVCGGRMRSSVFRLDYNDKKDHDIIIKGPAVIEDLQSIGFKDFGSLVVKKA
jgi:hypothetical protein